MQNNGIAFLGLVVIGLIALGGFRGAKIAKDYQSTNRHKIACQRAEEWLDEVISTSKKTTSTVPAELQVLRRHCWGKL